MPSVYLAGPIKGLSYDEATDWRIDVEHQLQRAGIRSLSPLRFKDYLKDEKELKENYPGHNLSKSKTLFTRDMMDVRTSDLILANFLGAEKVSIGTCVELGVAFEAKKPVIVIMEAKSNPHDHDFVKNIACCIVHNIPSAVDLVISFLK